MSGYLDNLSESQTKALEEFKKKLKSNQVTCSDGSQPDDYVCLRFLRARKFDVDAAAELFTKSQDWRLENYADHIVQDPPTATFAYASQILPSLHSGFDKQGRPLYWQRTAAIPLGAIQKYIPSWDFVEAHIWDMEMNMKRCEEQTARLGKRIETVANVLDLKGLGLRHKDLIPMLKAVTTIDQDNYPETLGRTFVVNSPSIFPALWSVIKAFLDPVVASKVVILGSNYQSTLLEFIDKDQIPEEYGGTSKASLPTALDDSKATALLSGIEAKLHLTSTVLKNDALELSFDADFLRSLPQGNNDSPRKSPSQKHKHRRKKKKRHSRHHSHQKDPQQKEQKEPQVEQKGSKDQQPDQNQSGEEVEEDGSADDVESSISAKRSSTSGLTRGLSTSTLKDKARNRGDLFMEPENDVIDIQWYFRTTQGGAYGINFTIYASEPSSQSSSSSESTRPRAGSTLMKKDQEMVVLSMPKTYCNYSPCKGRKLLRASDLFGPRTIITCVWEDVAHKKNAELRYSIRVGPRDSKFNRL